MSDNFNNTDNLLINTADTSKTSETFLDNGQTFLDFSQNGIGHQIMTSEVVCSESKPCSQDSFYYPNVGMAETPGTIIALEPVVLSDENDSDAPLLGTSLDSLETVGVEPSIPMERNGNYGLSNRNDDPMIDVNKKESDNLVPQDNILYNGSYVGSTGSDIPLLGASSGSEKSSTEDIAFNSETMVNSHPSSSDPDYGYQQPPIVEPSTTFYTQTEPDFVSSFAGSSPASDTPLLDTSLVSFETAETKNTVDENENPIYGYVDSGENTEVSAFPQLPAESTNNLLSYLDPTPSSDPREVITANDIFQEAELRQFQEAELASCSLANNQINNNVNVVNSILVCATDNTINDTIGSSYCNEDSDTPLLDLSPCVSLAENLDKNPVLAGTPADTSTADIPVEEFPVDQIHNTQPTAVSASFENINETTNDNMKTYTKQISTESNAPLIEEEPVRRDFGVLDIPPNYRVIECEPSFNMSKAAPYLHLYGSSKLLSSPHCASREHVNLSEACIHMLNHLNNSYSNMSLMQFSSLKDISDAHLQKLDADSDSEEEQPGKHWKNLFAYSIGFMVMYMAFGSLRHLQSSLNSEAGVGLMTLSCLFAFFVIGSLFASYVVKKLEPRRATLVTVLFHLLYVISNCYPKVYILMPVSAMLGFWNAVSWGASGTYIQRLACSYAAKTNQKTEHVCSKFHGIFYLIIFFSEVFGNLISSLILGSNSSAPMLVSQNNTMSSLMNETVPSFPENISSQYAHCGVSYSHSDDVNTETVQVDQTTIFILTAVFAGMDILAFFILFFCVDPLTMYYKCQTSSTNVGSCWQVWQDVKAVLVFMTDWRFIMLIPLYMFSAIHIGYISAEITKAFVTCFLGIHMVGYMMICYGISDAFSSYITGWLNQITGRIVLLSIGSLLFQLIIMFLLVWQPDSASLIPFILIFAIWGMSDGFYASQLCSLTGIMFSETCEEAFSAYRMMQGVGLTIAYSYAPILPLDIKLYMLSGLGIISWVLYVTMEYLDKRSAKIKALVADYQQTTV